MRTAATAAKTVVRAAAPTTTAPYAVIVSSGNSPTAHTMLARISPAIPDATRDVRDAAVMTTWMFTLAATMTRPASAAVAPSIATLYSCQFSSASMLAG